LRIPYAPTEAEQLKLLGIMAAEVNTGDRVSLDITHGFRHLPMLALLSALHLREAKNATIEGIWYGAYDSDTKKAPVYNLAGLLRMADWIGALRTFDKDGDYGAFAYRLDQDGLASVDTNHLRRAAFFERTSNPRDARKELANFDKVLARGLPGVGALFADQLRHRLKWHRSGDTFTNQADLATFYRKRGDYIRAAIFAYEAFVTRLIDREAGEREDNYKHREAAFKAYEKGERGNQRLKSDYWLLKNLRNTLAHGNEPDDKDDKRDRRLPGITTDEERLNRELERLIQMLLRASG
jgi:CRISPR-associated DxTHG motif protein